MYNKRVMSSTCQSSSSDIDFLINMYGMSDNRKIYEKIYNFEGLLKTGIAFLDGRITESFNHLGKIDEETLVLVDDLKILHEKGILTLDSQPRESTRGYVIEYGTDKGKKADIEQKEYVECIVHNSDVCKIIKCLENNKDFLYEFVNLKDGSTISNWGKDSYVLSRDRLHNNDWENHSFASRRDVKDYFHGLDDLPVFDDIVNSCSGLLIHVKYFNSLSQPIKHLKDFL